MQASLAASHGNDYGMAMAIVAGVVAVVIAALIFFSRERRGIDMTRTAREAGAPG
jgi:SHS family lactate transporter-like MFS transporter